MTTIDNLSKFGTSFQSKAIAAILSNKSFLEQTHDILDPKHFESSAHNWIIEVILWYYAEYRVAPTLEVFKNELTKLPSRDDGLKEQIVNSLREVYVSTSANDISYIKDEFLTFCKNQTLKSAILKSADKLNNGDFEGIKVLIDKALHAGQERNFGHEWKTQIEARLTQAARITIPTEWDVINAITDGGLGAGELGVVVAPPGGGKSWGLVSIGKSALKLGKKVLHYTFELNETYLGVRYDSAFTGLEPKQMRDNIDIVKNHIEAISGELYLKFFPTRTCSSISLHSHINQLTSVGFKPDLIIVDYADLMRPTEKGDGRWQDLGIVYEDLRGLAGELQVPVWTASQSQRSSLNVDVIEADKIAESFNKIMVSDFIISVSRKLSDKVSNTARAHVIKNRFGPDGLTFPVRADFAKGQLQIFEPESAEGMQLRREMESGDESVKAILQKKLIEFNNSNGKPTVDEDDF